MIRESLESHFHVYGYVEANQTLLYPDIRSAERERKELVIHHNCSLISEANSTRIKERFTTMASLLVTPTSSIGTTIQVLKAAGLRDKVKVMVGCVPVTEAYAA